MRLKIWCDGESEKFCKIFWELNKACIVAMLPMTRHSLIDVIWDLRWWLVLVVLVEASGPRSNSGSATLPSCQSWGEKMDRPCRGDLESNPRRAQDQEHWTESHAIKEDAHWLQQSAQKTSGGRRHSALIAGVDPGTGQIASSVHIIELKEVLLWHWSFTNRETKFRTEGHMNSNQVYFTAGVVEITRVKCRSNWNYRQGYCVLYQHAMSIRFWQSKSAQKVQDLASTESQYCLPPFLNKLTNQKVRISSKENPKVRASQEIAHRFSYSPQSWASEDWKGGRRKKHADGPCICAIRNGWKRAKVHFFQEILANPINNSLLGFPWVKHWLSNM